MERLDTLSKKTERVSLSDGTESVVVSSTKHYDDAQIYRIYSKLSQKKMSTSVKSGRLSLLPTELYVRTKWLMIPFVSIFRRHDNIDNHTYSIELTHPFNQVLAAKQSSKRDSISIVINYSSLDQAFIVTISWTSYKLPKSTFAFIINTLKDMIDLEIRRELLLLEVRQSTMAKLSKQTKQQLQLNKAKEIDRVIHPEKYAKPKGRNTGKGGTDKDPGRYRPSAELQARRTIKRG